MYTSSIATVQFSIFTLLFAFISYLLHLSFLNVACFIKERSQLTSFALFSVVDDTSNQIAHYVSAGAVPCT